MFQNILHYNSHQYKLKHSIKFLDKFAPFFFVYKLWQGRKRLWYSRTVEHNLKRRMNMRKINTIIAVIITF